MKKAKYLSKLPVIVGHRGYPKVARENTLESFLAALKAGAEMVEIDARITSDNVLVAYHDETLPNGRKIRETGSGEILSYGIEEVEKLIKSLPQESNIMLDVKDEVCWMDVAQLVKDRGLSERVIIAGNPNAVVKISKEIDVLSAPSFELLNWRESLRRTIEAGCDAVNDHYLAFDEEVLKEAKRLNLLFVTYTVNEMEEIVKLLRAGVDFIVTDEVEMAVRIKNHFFGMKTT
jgi:glycerophosphoryl diester phosphodiesterase